MENNPTIQDNKDNYFTDLEDIKALPQNLGLAILLNPFPDHTSAQRLYMWSSHLPQVQLIKGCEFPRVFTGYEMQVGDYEYNTTARDCDIQIISIIPRIISNLNTFTPTATPYYTVVYRRTDNDKVGYFNLERYTFRSDGYGYENKWLNSQLYLKEGMLIPKDVPLCTSPAHDGYMYKMGVNLKTAYISLPQVTEDAFFISESAAKKLCSTGIGMISIKVNPNQIALNLYGNEDEYKIFPDIGDCVNINGELCALRTPTPDSIIHDLMPSNLNKIQYLHDQVYYIPPQAKIIDVDVYINRNTKIKIPDNIFSQLTKYYEAIKNYDENIWNIYQKIKNEGLEITPEFNNLVTTSLGRLIMNGVNIPNSPVKNNIKVLPIRKKEKIDYIYITITYKYDNVINRGFKISGRYGNKGTISRIVPDEWMPIDEFGNRAEICLDPVSVFNRMNPSQLYEQFFNFAAEKVRKDMIKMVEERQDYNGAMNYALEFLNDIHGKWSKHVAKEYENDPSRLHEIVNEIIRDGFFMQFTPFQKKVDQHLVQSIIDKYHIRKTPVEFITPLPDGTLKKIKSKQAVMIGYEYWFSLYKMPHMRTTGLGYTNQFRSPTRPSSIGSKFSPISQTPIRLGEDEIRNIMMVAGGETAAHMLGVYANSRQASENLSRHLAFDDDPSKLEITDVSLKEIIDSNTIVSMSKHIFSTLGINICPDEETVNRYAANDVGIEEEQEFGNEDDDSVEESDNDSDNDKENDVNDDEDDDIDE